MSAKIVSLIASISLFIPTVRSHATDTIFNRKAILSKNRGQQKEEGIVLSTRRILLPGYPGAYNPSLIGDGSGYLLTFRITPDKRSPWVSYIGIARLNKKLELEGVPQLINPRAGLSRESPSQAEDARIFSLKGELYLIYNDNEAVLRPSACDRRDMYVAKLKKVASGYEVEEPLLLRHTLKYEEVLWQKNWTPFVWNDQLLISYTIAPHEVLLVDMESGLSFPCYQTPTESGWRYGVLRGGTPFIDVDGEYFSFFHSAIVKATKESKLEEMHHYYMGAMAVEKEPPFRVTKITPTPIIGRGFYTISDFHKRVVFPGGFVVDGDLIHVAYGKDDSQVWIATIDKNALKAALAPLQSGS